MALHIAQLRECKVCSLFCSINEEKSFLGFLHLWRRDQSPVSTAVWFVGSHKIIRVVPESLQGSLFPSPLPFVHQLWPEGSPWTLIPSIWEKAACRRDGRAPLIFFYMKLRLKFSFANIQHWFSALCHHDINSIFWELTHALYELFFPTNSLLFFLPPEMLTFKNPREMMVNSRTGCRLLLAVMPFTIAQQELLRSMLTEPYHCAHELPPWWFCVFKCRLISDNTGNWISACFLGEFLGRFWNSPWLHLDLLFTLFISTTLLCGNNIYMAVCYCSWQLCVYFWE